LQEIHSAEPKSAKMLFQKAIDIALQKTN